VCGGWTFSDFALEGCPPLIKPFINHCIHYGYMVGVCGISYTVYHLALRDLIAGWTGEPTSNHGPEGHVLAQINISGRVHAQDIHPGPETVPKPDAMPQVLSPQLIAAIQKELTPESLARGLELAIRSKLDTQLTAPGLATAFKSAMGSIVSDQLTQERVDSAFKSAIAAQVGDQLSPQRLSDALATTMRSMVEEQLTPERLGDTIKSAITFKIDERFFSHDSADATQSVKGAKGKEQPTREPLAVAPKSPISMEVGKEEQPSQDSSGGAFASAIPLEVASQCLRKSAMSIQGVEKVNPECLGSAFRSGIASEDDDQSSLEPAMRIEVTPQPSLQVFGSIPEPPTGARADYQQSQQCSAAAPESAFGTEGEEQRTQTGSAIAVKSAIAAGVEEQVTHELLANTGSVIGGRLKLTTRDSPSCERQPSELDKEPTCTAPHTDPQASCTPPPGLTHDSNDPGSGSGVIEETLVYQNPQLPRDRGKASEHRRKSHSMLTARTEGGVDGRGGTLVNRRYSI